MRTAGTEGYRGSLFPVSSGSELKSMLEEASV